MLCIYRFQFPEMFKLDLYFFEHSKRSTLCLIIPLSDACGICFCCLLFLLGFVHSVIFPVCGSSLNVCWTFTSPQLPFLQPSQKNLRVKDINSSRVPTLFPSGFHLTLIFKVLLGNYSERSENVTHSYKYLTPPPHIHTHTSPEMCWSVLGPGSEKAIGVSFRRCRSYSITNSPSPEPT